MKHSQVFPLYSRCLIRRRRFGTVQTLLNSSFNIYANKCIVPSGDFFREVYLMNNKLLYYVNDYFKLSNYPNKGENKIGCLFPPCYSQLIFKFCILLNNFDYISIPTPIKKSKQTKQKYSFYIAENNIDLILCHPFYKHYIEDISFNLQIPFLICYDKPDILSHDEYLEDLREGRENFARKFEHYFKREEDYSDDEKKAVEEMKKMYLIGYTPGKNYNYNCDSSLVKENKFAENVDEIRSERDIIQRGTDISFHLQLSKQNECDKSIKFLFSNIFNQSKQFANFLKLTGKNDYVLVCMPANNIQYFDVLFSLMYTGATIVFPETCKRKLLNSSNYMEWFKKYMKNKNNNFAIHDLIVKTNFEDVDFDFIDGSSLFEEIQNVHCISMFVCNNYLIRDFITFFENSDINNVTKKEFIQEKASNVHTILINGNELMPGINKKYVEKIKKIFPNAKIYQRYVIQEIGTVSVMELGQLEEDNIPYERNIAGYVLPNVHIEIDDQTNLLKIKSDTLFTEYYNNRTITSKSFDGSGFFKTKYLASITENSLLKIEGLQNEIENIPQEYYLYFKQRRDKMEKHPPGYLKKVRLQGQIWGNFHANKRNWKRKF
ncbi:conserved Plasmodium protein, unknown function [Plasmodium ovale]|uniref:AMP-dependent synthetase/ligase domain-containing protein n=1 Tax=Plasmodium ovale TaxID=36330 RepID=A0A1C3KRA6_PLAOA|nr:conserved Plasmodium protein, unknown function [Plasmodium ovale]